MKKGKIQKGIFGKILKVLQPYRWGITLSILLSVVAVLLMLYVPVLAGRAIDNIWEEGNVNFTAIIQLLFSMVLVVCGNSLINWVISVVNNRIAYHTVREIRNQAFYKIQILPFRYLDTHSSGETVNRIVSDVDQVADGLLLGFSQFFSGITTIVGTFIFMMTISPWIAFIVVLITPVSLVVANFISRRTHHMFKEQSEIRAEQTGFMDEAISNLKVVKAFSHEEENKQVFDEINGRLQKCSLRAIFYSSLTNPSTRFVNSLIYAAVALFGALLCVATLDRQDAFTIGSLTALLAYANQYTKPFNEISGVITELQNSLVCASRVFAIIEEEPQIPDQADAVILAKANGEVELKDVSFSYDPSVKLLKNLNLCVTPGMRVAIVGPTGCGKTTLINLLMRFYDVDEGGIFVDKTDIRYMTRKSLRANYGMVLQDTWIKAGTVRENIRMGRKDVTDEDIISTAKAAHAHGFIKRLPHGYDTVLGEDGGSLSQGQKQLLCISRIMLCLPSMLILDEATSSIDTRTEMKIQKTFHEMMKGRTTFIVAHRLSTIRQADIILVMKNGDIIEKGTHDTLLQQQGFYYELYNSQFQNFSIPNNP